MNGLLILLLFLLTGNLLNALFSLPVPGSIIGMLLLLVYLIIRGHIPESLQKTTQFLAPLMPLFIVPVSVGIVTQKELIAEHGVTLGLILLVSLFPGALVCAWVMQVGRNNHKEQTEHD